METYLSSIDGLIMIMIRYFVLCKSQGNLSVFMELEITPRSDGGVFQAIPTVTVG
jgi:hypothetical protein